MAGTTTKLTITNRALQLVGYQSISSVQQNDRGARAMNRAYRPVLDSMLTENYWAFAVRRASLPASATPPIHGKNFAYPLPGDYAMLAPEDQFDGRTTGTLVGTVGSTSDFPLSNDWIIEGGEILTNEEAPLDIRYMSLSVNEASFDPLFAEAFAAQLALMTVEELTQSNTKFAMIQAIHDRQIKRARQRNAIISPKAKAPASAWLNKRA